MSLKKKLLILSSTGGYGHIAAASTLENLLSRDYDLETIYPINELEIFNIPNGESLYNFFLTNNLTAITNWVVKNFVAKLFAQRKKKMEKLIEAHIREKRIDLVVSLIPFFNHPASEAARRMGVPFLLITTDNDLHNWVCQLEDKTHAAFKVTIGADLPTSRARLLQKKITEDEIELTGLPLRPDFLDINQSKEELRAEHGIPQNKPVVLIMMGGTGARLCYQYAKILSQSKLGIHMVICSGRNVKIVRKLRSIQPQHGNTMDVIPFTERVHEYFALADLILTKPGPGTINEAIACKLPIIIDRVKAPLFWEEANVDLVTRFGIGQSIRNIKDTPDVIRNFLFNEQMQASVQQAYRQIPENQFAIRIKPLIEEMTGQNISGEVVMTSRTITPLL